MESFEDSPPMLNPPLSVTYEDAANGVPDVKGNITNLVAFCRAIQEGHIRNVRMAEPEPLLRIDGLAHLITLERSGPRLTRLTLTYGAEVERDLGYTEAAKRLGVLIMHALQCDGKLDGVA